MILQIVATRELGATLIYFERVDRIVPWHDRHGGNYPKLRKSYRPWDPGTVLAWR